MFHRSGIDWGVRLSVARVWHAHGRADGERAGNGAQPGIIEVDAEDNVILVKGAVPGPNGGYVILRRAKR